LVRKLKFQRVEIKALSQRRSINRFLLTFIYPDEYLENIHKMIKISPNICAYYSAGIVFPWIFREGIQVQEKRFALVIGNGNYKSSPLRNQTNDAHDLF